MLYLSSIRLQNFASYLSQHNLEKTISDKKADTIISKVVIFGLKKQVRNFFLKRKHQKMFNHVLL